MKGNYTVMLYSNIVLE